MEKKTVGTKETVGTVVSVSRHCWLKVNRKPIRANALDGAKFPHIIKIAYRVNESEYTKRKWLGAGQPVPSKGSSVKIVYDESKPSKAKVLF